MLTIITVALVAIRCAISASGQAYTIINGGGSSAAASYINANAAIASFLSNAPIQINYNTSSSTIGRNAAVTRQLDFAISDVPFPASAYPSNFSQIPFVLGVFSVATNYNISGFVLDAATLAGIYSCNLTTWDQVAAASNQTFNATGRLIPVARADSSGSTELLTQYLATTGPTVWPYGVGPLIPWPACVLTAVGSDNVASLMNSVSRRAIGYMEFGIARNASLVSAALMNAAGNYVDPATASGSTYDSLAEAAFLPQSVASAAWDNLTLEASETPDAYPITSIEYFLLPTRLSGIPSRSPRSQSLLKQFLGFLLSLQTQSAAASTSITSFGALPADIRSVAVRGQRNLTTANTADFGLPQPGFDTAQTLPVTSLSPTPA